MHLHRFARPALLAALACTAPAYAAIVGNGTPGSCTESALDAALSGGGVVTFDCGGPATIVLTATKALTLSTQIDGGGLITLDGGGAVQLFRLSGAASSYTLRGLVLSNGKATNDSGGAVYVDGATLLLNDVTLLNNTAMTAVFGGGLGGAVYAQGGAQVTLSRVTASGNSAEGGGAIFTIGAGTTLLLSEFVAQGNHALNTGGAITHKGSALTIQDSLFSANTVQDVDGVGGAVQVGPVGGTSSSLAIANSTFQGNTSRYGSALSAALLSPGGSIANSTFADNTGSSAIIAWNGAALTLKNTIVSNSVNGLNCVTDGGTITDGGSNLQFGGNAPPDSCGATIAQANPLLAPLANNGGFSQTMALQPGSPAIDAGSGCTPFDQRGVTRPIGPACDIGAFEAPLAAPGGGGQVASVPALGPWSLPLLAALLGMAGLRQRRKP